MTVSILIVSTCIDMPLLARKVLEAKGPGWYQSALKKFMIFRKSSDPWADLESRAPQGFLEIAE